MWNFAIAGIRRLNGQKQMPFGLILMDIQMPDMDGIRACELIHQLPHQQQTPVIAVTAHAIAGQKEKLLARGMSDYLAKPIEEERLHNLLLRYKPGSGISSRVVTPEVNKLWSTECDPRLATGTTPGSRKNRFSARYAANVTRFPA